MAKEKATAAGSTKREVTAEKLKPLAEDKGFAQYKWICPTCGYKDNPRITTKFSPPAFFRACKKCQTEILIYNPKIYQ